MNYFINSNTGDYISEENGIYKLYLITRYDPIFVPDESMQITYSQFISLKGFIPIKKKKLFSRRHYQVRYAPTLPDGTKGVSKRVELPSKADVRDEILRQLGL